MLPQKYRLRSKSDFQKVLKKGKVIQGKFLGLAVYRGEDGPAKLGIIVSNKISKKAVVRNRVKRILRRAARDYMLTAPSGLLLVFLAKKAIVEQEAEDIVKEASALLKKA